MRKVARDALRRAVRNAMRCVTRCAPALACAALGALPARALQVTAPPPAVRVPGARVAPPRRVLPALEAADAVERELAARAIALGEVDEGEIDALLAHADWTLRHLALDALARTPAARQSWRHHQALDRALEDPRVELRVAALRVLVCDDLSAATVLRVSADPAPEVRLAAVRGLAALFDPRERWSAPEEEFPAHLFRGEGAAVALARRLAWTSGPSLSSVRHALPSVDWSGDTWLAAQPAEALAPGAWAALAREYAALTGGDPWTEVVACFDECLAHRDWRRGPLAHVLRDLADTPGERAVAFALLAHVRPLTDGEAATLAAGVADLCARFGADDAARVLLPAARLVSPTLARALLGVVHDTTGDARELVVRCAAEALGPTVLGELPLDTASDVLVACARNALARGARIDGERLARFAGHADLDVREALFTLASDALSSGRVAMAVPLLERMLTDPERDLAAAAFRTLAGGEVAPELEPRLYVVWRALPDEPTRRVWLRDLSRAGRWVSFTGDLLRVAAEAHAPEFVELLAPLADDPRVRGALARWFEEDVAALCAVHGREARLVFDGRAAGLAKALHEARGLAPDLDLGATFERALLATMHALHPVGERSRAKLPKALVALLGADESEDDALLGADGPGFAALQRVLAAHRPRAPRRVRTEAAIVLAERRARALDSTSVVDALVDGATESEPELAVRAVRALAALPPPARAVGVARLLEQWDTLGAESVRIALVELAAPDPAHGAALQRIARGASDDSVAGALIEATAASQHGRATSLEDLARFEELLDWGSVRGDPRPRGGPPELTAEQALVRREAVLLGLARAAAPLPDEVAARLFVRPLAASRGDLGRAFQGEPTAGAEFRFRGELAIGEALARERRLGAALVSDAGITSTAAWWEADAELLAALARRAAPHEPAAAARLAEAALVALQGLPEGRREREGRATRTELLALWLAAESAAGEAPGAFGESQAATHARMEHLEHASDVAAELVAGMALTNLERGASARDTRGLDLRTIERLFGAPDPGLGVDPRARLAAAVDQLALHALLGFLARGDVTTTGFVWTRDFEAAFSRADWVARSRAARAFEERLAERYGQRYDGLVPDRARARRSEPAPVTGGR